MENNERMMTSVDVAEYLQVPVSTVRGWRVTGRGPRAVAVGRHVRYRRSDVEAWLDQQGTAKAAS